jgi:hypothetical protein
MAVVVAGTTMLVTDAIMEAEAVVLGVTLVTALLVTLEELLLEAEAQVDAIAQALIIHGMPLRRMLENLKVGMVLTGVVLVFMVKVLLVLPGVKQVLQHLPLIPRITAAVVLGDSLLLQLHVCILVLWVAAAVPGLFGVLVVVTPQLLQEIYRNVD